MNVRKTALSLLFRMENEGAYLNLILPPQTAGEDPRDRAFLTSLLYGVTERRLTLDYAIGVYCGKPADSLTSHTKNLLRLGLYQLFYMDKIPAFAAVSETVSLSEHGGERGLVNAVLRRASKDTALPLPPRDKKLDRYLSIAYSLPRESVKELLSAYGSEKTEEILASFLTPPSLTLRVNTAKTTREKLLSDFRAAGFSAYPTENAPFGIHLPSAPPATLPGYGDGLFYVQDEASMIAVEAGGYGDGESVLDLCAAPGGKSFGAALKVGKNGNVLSCDLHASKLSLVESGRMRLGIENITVCENDATVFSEAYENAFDAVIADVPCSGLGVLGKKPDMRYASHDRFETLLPLQAAILENASRYVKTGGRLMYSTCTLRPQENENRVTAFLASHPDYTYEDFRVGCCQSQNGMLTLFPDKNGSDGFFVARLRKVK